MIEAKFFTVGTYLYKYNLTVLFVSPSKIAHDKLYIYCPPLLLNEIYAHETYLSKRFLCVSQHCTFPGEQPSALCGQGHVWQFELKETFIEKHQQLNHPRWQMKTLKRSTFPLNVTQRVFEVSYSPFITCIACSFPIGAPKAVLLWA